jgi:tRNA (guanine-N7-)-methyltransferase
VALEGSARAAAGSDVPAGFKIVFVPFGEHARPPGWPGTRYEAKALREGRSPIYWTFARR